MFNRHTDQIFRVTTTKSCLQTLIIFSPYSAPLAFPSSNKIMGRQLENGRKVKDLIDKKEDFCGLESVWTSEILRGSKQKARNQGLFISNWWRRRESNPLIEL